MSDSNPAFQYVTGAVHIYARITPRTANASAPIQYLGTCEKAPEEDKLQVWAPYHNSIGGEIVEFDKTYQGVKASIKMDLNRFNNTVLRAVADAPNQGRTGPVVDGGKHGVGDIGRMLVANRCTFELWLVNHMWLFRQQATNMNDFADLEPGTYYPGCGSARRFDGRKGVTPNMVYLEVEAQRIYDPGERSFFTYSCDPAYFASIPLPL